MAFVKECFTTCLISMVYIYDLSNLYKHENYAHIFSCSCSVLYGVIATSVLIYFDFVISPCYVCCTYIYLDVRVYELLFIYVLFILILPAFPGMAC